MQHVQGYTGSYWMLPLSNYLLHMFPQPPWGQQTKQQCKMYPLPGHFDGRGNAPVLYLTHHLVEEDHGFPKSH
jgi:hypothetical protein